MAGNKGGIAIRLDWADSSFCFVTAHFAAGTSNVDERDQDYRTISEGLVFRRGRFIHDHECAEFSIHFLRMSLIGCREQEHHLAGYALLAS